MKPRFALVVAVLTLAPVAIAGQQTAPAAPPPEAAPAPAVIPVGTRVGVPDSGYSDGGRRDPFMSLVQTKRTTSPEPSLATARKPKAGLAGIALADVVVRGITKTGTTMLAILAGPNNQSYIAHPKDRLADGYVESIDAAGVVLADDVTPGGRSTRIRKALRPAGSGEDVR